MMLANRLGIDLRNDQRHLRVHPKRGGIIHDHGAPLDGFRDKRLRNLSSGAEEGNVHALKLALGQLVHGNRLAPEG